jgi:hypothetical protein
VPNAEKNLTLDRARHLGRESRDWALLLDVVNNKQQRTQLHSCVPSEIEDAVTAVQQHLKCDYFFFLSFLLLFFLSLAVLLFNFTLQLGFIFIKNTFVLLVTLNGRSC